MVSVGEAMREYYRPDNESSSRKVYSLDLEQNDSDTVNDRRAVANYLEGDFQMSVLTMPPRQKRNDLPAKVDAYVLRLAKILAAHEDSTITQIISEAMLPILIKRLEKLGVPFPPPPIQDK